MPWYWVCTTIMGVYRDKISQSQPALLFPAGNNEVFFFNSHSELSVNYQKTKVNLQEVDKNLNSYAYLLEKDKWLVYLGFTCFHLNCGGAGVMLPRPYPTKIKLKNKPEQKWGTSEHWTFNTDFWGHQWQRQCVTVGSRVGLCLRGFNNPLGLLFIK